MYILPIPLPDDDGLAQFVAARYSASPEERINMDPPPLAKTRDGFLTAMHFFYQNNPWVFIGGSLISISAALHAVFRMGQWLMK